MAAPGDDNDNIEINVEQFELQLQNSNDGVDIVSDLAKDERIIDEQFHEDESCIEDTATPVAVNRKKTYTIAGLALVCVVAIAIGAAAGINKKNGDAAAMSASAALEAYCQDLVTASFEKQEEESKPTPSPTNPPLFYSNDVAADIFINDDNEQLRRELRGRRGGKNRVSYMSMYTICVPVSITDALTSYSIYVHPLHREWKMSV